MELIKKGAAFFVIAVLTNCLHAVYATSEVIPGITPPKAKVYLLAGQSNMVGHGLSGDLANFAPELNVPRDDVSIKIETYDDFNIAFEGLLSPLQPGFGFHSGKFGPELGMGNVLGETLNEHVYLFKSSKSNSRLADPEQWLPGTANNLYDQTITRFKKFLTEELTAQGIEYEVVGFVWFQGESDAKDGYHLEYETNLRYLLTSVRTDLGIPTLPAVIVQINDGWANGTTVMQAQATVAADANNALVITNDLYAFMHYDAPSNVVIGNRIGYAALHLMGYPSASPDSYVVAMNSTLSVATPGVLTNDNCATTASLVGNVSHGTLTFNSDGSFDYTPNDGYIGPDSFSYNVSNAGISGNTVTVQLWSRNVQDGLVLHLPLDEESGATVVIDSVGGIPAEVAKTGVTLGQEGRIGKAAAFNGTSNLVDDGFIRIRNSPMYPFLLFGTDNDVTIATWVKIPKPIAATSIIFSNGDAYDHDGIHIFTDYPSFGSIAQVNPVSETVNDTLWLGNSYLPIDDGFWHHLCVVVDRTTGIARNYIDATEVYVNLMPLTMKGLSLDPGYNIWLGSAAGVTDLNNKKFNGLMDDFRMYFRALSATEVKALMTTPTEVGYDLDGDGYTTTGGDCDDTDPAVHPGVQEICGDGIDNDCNGLIDPQNECNPFECLYDAQCGANAYCKKTIGNCGGMGLCASLPSLGTLCTVTSEQVCGCDGKNYPSACEADLLGVNVAATAECAISGYKWTYYFPAVMDNDEIGWENYLSVAAKDPVPMAVTIRAYDLAGELKGSFVYSSTDPAANVPALAPFARVALRPSFIVGNGGVPQPLEGSLVVETSVPAIASTNSIGDYYEGFSIYEAAKVKNVHYFPKAYDGPNFYQVYMYVQNIYDADRNVTVRLFGKNAGDPGDGVTWNVDIPAHGTLKFRPSEIAGGIDFNGSVVVYSNLNASEDGLGLPIPAMCVYRAGVEALAIYESTARQLQLSFPVLKDGKFGGAFEYQNFVSLMNMNPTAATITIVLYNKAGVEEARLADDVIPPGGKKTWRPSFIKGSLAIPADFEGSAVILSNMAIVGQTNTIYSGNNIYGAAGFDLFESAMGAQTIFFPKAFDNLLGADAKTGTSHLIDNYVYVSNPDATAKDIKIEQFNNDGQPNGVRGLFLNANATYVFRPKDLILDSTNVFRGSVRVTEASGKMITGAIKYEIHKTTVPTSEIEAMTIYRSMGQ